MSTIVKECTCKHEFQDEKYGKGKRVHNVGGNKDRVILRCTVCGKDNK